MERQTNELRALCSQYTSSRTAQLFDVERRFSKLIPSALATGVLVAFCGRWMVITASHVLDSRQVQERGIYVLADKNGFINLGDFSFVRTGSAGDRVSDDDIDLAVLFLEDSVADQLQNLAGLKFVEIVEIDSVSSTQFAYSSLFFVHGYPIDMTYFARGKADVSRTSLAVFLSKYDQSRGIWPAIYENAHFDLDYEMGSTVAQLEIERSLNLPHPSGFSGCGLWHVALSDRESTADAPPVFLAGVVHRFNEELQVLRATRLEVLLRILNS